MAAQTHNPVCFDSCLQLVESENVFLVLRLNQDCTIEWCSRREKNVKAPTLKAGEFLSIAPFRFNLEKQNNTAFISVRNSKRANWQCTSATANRYAIFFSASLIMTTVRGIASKIIIMKKGERTQNTKPPLAHSGSEFKHHGRYSTFLIF